ncbi:hydroxyacylglutathione hydrolase [Azospirillum griseum]|uniref:Hydroxyacylglutathione hydrolase n=1 Tax=Azospirillum griseum TaxID=2496639 RepID=A0A431VF54_9PROT|nr:hydroxyacylglutathione hydrolase [Azospirillum griseum]RTR18342.1 hydroxyacylglutathione hydrolase [Azospirillum griseum]
MEIILVPAFADNYLYVLRDPASGKVAAVDPGDAAPLMAELERRGWGLDLILLTHHHNDHTGGVAALVERYAPLVVGAGHDSHRLPPLGRAVADGDRVAFGGTSAEVIATPGHTLGHIAYWFAQDEALFCADTLFALGCGRLFEGTPGQMWESLLRLRALPDATRVCCAHEYTLSNARFAVTVDPDNAALRARAEEIAARRARHEPTVPTLLGVEKATNPFLRADDPGVAAAVGLVGSSPDRVFAELRARKDRF